MSVHIALAKVKKEVGRLQACRHPSGDEHHELERLQEHGISDPVCKYESTTLTRIQEK